MNVLTSLRLKSTEFCSQSLTQAKDFALSASIYTCTGYLVGRMVFSLAPVSALALSYTYFTLAYTLNGIVKKTFNSLKQIIPHPQIKKGIQYTAYILSPLIPPLVSFYSLPQHLLGTPISNVSLLGRSLHYFITSTFLRFTTQYY